MLAEFRILINTNETRVFASSYSYWNKFSGSKDRFKCRWTAIRYILRAPERTALTAPTPRTQTHAPRTLDAKNQTAKHRNIVCNIISYVITPIIGFL